jgi:hypothetical protein
MAAAPVAIAAAHGSFLPGCATAPPPDFLNGPAYSGRDTWTSPAMGPSPASDGGDAARTTTTSATVAGTAGARAAGAEPEARRVLVRTVVHVLASDGDRVYYGDDGENALMAVPPEGGDPVLVARPAPFDLTLDGHAVVWIARPGNVVYRVARAGSAPASVGAPGSFTAVASGGRDVFVGESVATGGAVTRMSGTSMVRLATLEGPPRGVEVDDSFVYVVTAGDVTRIPRAGGPAQRLASVRDAAEPALDGDHLYATVASGQGRALVRVPKSGGPVVELVPAVRKGPIAVAGGQIYFLDPERPELLRIAAGGGRSTLVAREDAFAHVTALAVDDRRIYVGTERAGLVALARARTDASANAGDARTSTRTP